MRKREREFVRRVIACDTAAIQAAPLHEREQLQDLQTKWQESVERLRTSKLRKRGNPLYVLPLLPGDRRIGAGKTSAIKNASLSTPLAETVRTAGLAATPQLRVVAPRPGRRPGHRRPLHDSGGSGPRPRGVGKFLTLLAQYGGASRSTAWWWPSPPIASLAEDSAKLHADGEDVRQRIDQVMRVVGARFPFMSW